MCALKINFLRSEHKNQLQLYWYNNNNTSKLLTWHTTGRRKCLKVACLPLFYVICSYMPELFVYTVFYWLVAIATYYTIILCRKYIGAATIQDFYTKIAYKVAAAAVACKVSKNVHVSIEVWSIFIKNVFHPLHQRQLKLYFCFKNGRAIAAG